jgi:hypothetical protein
MSSGQKEARSPRGETAAHRELKRLAALWAQARGFSLCAEEVRLPRSGYRVDLAGCAAVRSGSVHAGETAVFECKQSRSDLLRDTADERASLLRLREVTTRCAELEQLLGLHLPSLRRGESLFAECDAYDLEGIRHDGLRAVRREEAALQAKVYGGTKFDRMFRYRGADRFHLVTGPGVMEPHEVPAGWGLLEAAGAELVELRRPERVETTPAARLALLQAIAAAGTRATNTALGVSWEEVRRLRGRVPPP